MRKARLERGLFQKDVARLCGVSKGNVELWEMNRADPLPRHHLKIMEFLGYVPFFLLPQTFGQAVKFLRSLHGMIQPEFADYLGVEKSTIQEWEHDTSCPKPINFEKLKSILRAIPAHSLVLPDEFLTRCMHLLATQYPECDGYPTTLRTWGDHLLKRRLDTQRTQQQAAEVMGVTNGMISVWEANKEQPSIRMLPRVIDFLGYVPWDFIPYGSPPQLLAFIRKVQGWDQIELARRIGVNPTSVVRWERGKKIKQYNYEKLLKILNISI